MLKREEWLDLARSLDWEFSYVSEKEAYPEAVSGNAPLSVADWKGWDEPYRTSFREYVTMQHEKDASVYAVRDVIGRIDDFKALPAEWISGLKLHAALLPLAEFDAVVGNLRSARFAKNAAWRNMALFGALDELRHTQIPLLIMHELVRWDRQFDWTHKFYHTNNWIAVAARHLFDELLLGANPVEFSIATNFVFETGFTNLQFIGLSALAHGVGDRMFETMLTSIQTDEARHAQIGPPVLKKIAERDPETAQYLLDKWFWRSWLVFSVATGFSMDYFTPLEHRTMSFKDFMTEWVLEQYISSIAEYGLKRPWYWNQFLEELESFHHKVYLSAYSYRATTWFDFPVPSPEEREWLLAKYPRGFAAVEESWKRIDERWKESGPGIEWHTHGATPVAFCRLCQLVLCAGGPGRSSARTVEHEGKRYIFCSEPCEWIFRKEPERYSAHRDVVARILEGKAPSNVLELVRKYFSLDRETWGKDLRRGDYRWLERRDGRGQDG